MKKASRFTTDDSDLNETVDEQIEITVFRKNSDITMNNSTTEM